MFHLQQPFGIQIYVSPLQMIHQGEKEIDIQQPLADKQQRDVIVITVPKGSIGLSPHKLLLQRGQMHGMEE